MAYPHADIEFDLCMHLLYGVHMANGLRRTHVLKLLRNIYGQKQAITEWYNHLKKGLFQTGFTQSDIDVYVFYCGNTLFLCYVDDDIFPSPDQEDIDKANMDLKNLNFDIKDKGNIEYYLGMKVEKFSGGSIKNTQPQIIQSTLDEVYIPPNLKINRALASSSRLLIQDMDTLEGDNSFATHQCARFCEDLRESHAAVVEHIAHYLMATKDKGIILDPNRKMTMDDASAAKSIC
eukprot:15350645-Ditylum_brightwellii.AAC.2